MVRITRQPLGWKKTTILRHSEVFQSKTCQKGDKKKWVWWVVFFFFAFGNCKLKPLWVRIASRLMGAWLRGRVRSRLSRTPRCCRLPPAPLVSNSLNQVPNPVPCKPALGWHFGRFCFADAANRHVGGDGAMQCGLTRAIGCKLQCRAWVDSLSGISPSPQLLWGRLLVFLISKVKNGKAKTSPKWWSGDGPP